MNKFSKKEIALLLTPAIAGLLFIALFFADHALFKNGIISVRQAIGHELLLFFMGLVITITVFFVAMKGLLQKQWLPTIIGSVSIVAFWLCIMFSASQGAAMFYAT